jgi:methionyl-tRNA formyltransferase
MPVPRVLLFGKSADPYFRQAVGLAERETDLTVHAGSRDEPFPDRSLEWAGDHIVSYLSPWILPAALIARASKNAINLHPGPPAYPGIGCTNFALYDGERTYGVTCHRMDPRVDTGPIVAVRRFPILAQDTVQSLTQRCHAAIFVLFGELLARLAAGDELPTADETWTRRPYRRAELDALCELTLAMPDDEVRRRIRATTYPNMPGPYVVIDGTRHPIADLAALERLRESPARIRSRP